ncbi:MAG: MBL fold metallo-hydrolase [Bacteroidales bacterium]|nr:MBL fold metallo-hydrolase [Bacteroidales bacterium]
MNLITDQSDHSDNKVEIIMLGTGSAFPSHSYNTCFLVRTEKFLWLTDGGGGNGIFTTLHNADVDLIDIRHIFVTHSHTDHILGIIWILRRFINLFKENKFHEKVNVYANRETVYAIREICRLTFLKSYFDDFKNVIELRIINSEERILLENVKITFIDTCSENVRQTGFRMDFPSGKSLISLGDEALNQQNAYIAENAECVMCGAFCKYTDRHIYHPYEKHHLTVKDVAETAESVNVRTLILYHSEDTSPDKTNAYIKEAQKYFSGEIYVPADYDHIYI